MVDYIIVGIIMIALALIVFRAVNKAKKGETGCGSGCSGCPSSSACHKEDTKL